ncbi:MAG: Lrp/AsnC family transcriptional regulator [Candidatus Woesearchaeota archaeon]|nr:Lrp/AsnC family transcriptional regulator [Candidatus Woesearchaeota archaeon]
MFIKIDSIDKRILYELEQNARMPDTQLAKLVGRSKESVRYRIKRLQEKNIITRFSTFIDPTKFGYRTYKMYLKLANVPEKRAKIISELKKNPHMFWVGAADGAWDLGLTFFAKNNTEFYRMQHDIVMKFGSLVRKKYTGVLVDVTLGSKDFLVDKQGGHVTLFGEAEQYTLSEMDKKLLQFLFVDARASVVSLARQVGSTVDIVRRRIKLFEEKNIIVQYKAWIDWKLLGYEFYKAFLFFKKLSVRDERRIMTYALQHRHIIHVPKQISPWDLEFEIMVTNYHDYNSIINDIKEQFVDIILDVESAVMSEDHLFPAKKVLC